MGHPEGADPSRFHLIAPFETDARRWDGLEWTDLHSGTQWQIATGLDAPYWKVRVKSFRAVIDSYATHPESKSAAADGSECDRTTVGLLSRRTVHGTGLVYLGKESNGMEEVEHGLIHSQDDVVNCYRDEESEWHATLLPKLLSMSRAEAAQVLGLSERAITALRRSSSIPSELTRRKLRARERAGGILTSYNTVQLVDR